MAVRVACPRALRALSGSRLSGTPRCRCWPSLRRWKSSNSPWGDLPLEEAGKVALGTVDTVLKGLKPAFHAHESPFRAAFESGRHMANTALKAVDAPVQLDVVQAKDESRVLHGDGERDHVSTWTGTTLVANKDIQSYVDCILNHPDTIVNNPWIPDVLERRVYMLVVKMVLQGLHFGCGVIDERVLFGQTLRIVQSRSQLPLERADVKLSETMISSIIDQVMMDAGNSVIISKRVDKMLYQNAIRFALRLVVDMASTLRVSTFGLKFSLHVSSDHDSLLKGDGRSPMDVAALDILCEPLIRELLADEDINISVLPDHLEEQLYKNVMRLLANVASAAADSSEIDIFGIRIEPDVQ